MITIRLKKHFSLPSAGYWGKKPHFNCNIPQCICSIIIITTFPWYMVHMRYPLSYRSPCSVANTALPYVGVICLRAALFWRWWWCMHPSNWRAQRSRDQKCFGCPCCQQRRQAMWRCRGNFSTFLKILLWMDACYLHTQTHTLCVKSSNLYVKCSEGSRFGSNNTSDLWHYSTTSCSRVKVKYLKCWHSSCS